MDTAFQQLYSHTPTVTASKQGVLELHEDSGEYKVFWFVLDDTTHSLTWYNTNFTSRQTSVASSDLATALTNQVVSK